MRVDMEKEGEGRLLGGLPAEDRSKAAFTWVSVG